MTLEDDLRQIKVGIANAQQQRARAEVQEENATKAVAEAKQTLKDDFGINTNEDIARVRAELEAELNDAVEEAKAQLANSGA